MSTIGKRVGDKIDGLIQAGSDAVEYAKTHAVPVAVALGTAYALQKLKEYKEHQLIRREADVVANLNIARQRAWHDSMRPIAMRELQEQLMKFRDYVPNYVPFGHDAMPEFDAQEYDAPPLPPQGQGFGGSYLAEHRHRFGKPKHGPHKVIKETIETLERIPHSWGNPEDRRMYEWLERARHKRFLTDVVGQRSRIHDNYLPSELYRPRPFWMRGFQPRSYWPRSQAHGIAARSMPIRKKKRR